MSDLTKFGTGIQIRPFRADKMTTTSTDAETKASGRHHGQAANHHHHTHKNDHDEHHKHHGHHKNSHDEHHHPNHHHHHKNHPDEHRPSPHHQYDHERLLDSKIGSPRNVHRASEPGIESVDGHERRSVETRAIEKERRHDQYHHHLHPLSENKAASFSHRQPDAMHEGHRHHQMSASKAASFSHRPSDAKHDGRHHRASGPGAEQVDDNRLSRLSLEERAREKELRQSQPGTHHSSSLRRISESKGEAGHHGHHHKSRRDGTLTAANGELASDRDKEIDDRLGRLDDVEKAYRERLSNMGNTDKNKQIPVAVATEDNSKKSNFCCSKPVLIVLVFLLLGGIAIALWFLVFNKQDSTVRITAIYDPPSAQDCEDIANGVISDGQTTMKIESYNVEIDVHSIVAEELPAILEELDAMIQQNLVTTLAGCDEENLLPDQNYVVASGSTSLVHQVNEACKNPTGTIDDSCYRITVNIDLYLKGDAPVEQLQTWIEEAFERDLGDSDTIEVISVIPDPASTSPTIATSFSPTFAPTTNSPTTKLPTAASFTMAPSSAPTALYEENSEETCASISNKESVPNQDFMVLTSFEVEFDVSLTLQPSDPSEVVAEMEDSMQRSIAPKLADCRDYRRFLNESSGRKLADLKRNVVGNAQFFLEARPNQSCGSSAPRPCIRVLGFLHLYLKADQEFFPVLNHVSVILGDADLKTTLNLEAPFTKIGTFGIAKLVPTMAPSSNPTLQPSVYPSSEPSSILSLSPTLIPSLAPSSIPSWVPSSSPTDRSIYEANSLDDCSSIEARESVHNQNTMIVKPFDVRFDVSLTLQLSDTSRAVADMGVALQWYMAPKLAGCPDRLLLDGGHYRKLEGLERNVVGDAEFYLEHQEPDQSCDSSAPTPCIRVLARLLIFLKGDQPLLPVVNHITTTLGEADLVTALELTAPFHKIEIVGITVAAPTQPPSTEPTTAPTSLPSVTPTPPPTPAPTPPPTPAPTLQPTPAPTPSPSVSPTLFSSPTPTSFPPV